MHRGSRPCSGRGSGLPSNGHPRRTLEMSVPSLDFCSHPWAIGKRSSPPFHRWGSRGTEDSRASGQPLVHSSQHPAPPQGPRQSARRHAAAGRAPTAGSPRGSGSGSEWTQAAPAGERQPRRGSDARTEVAPNANIKNVRNAAPTDTGTPRDLPVKGQRDDLGGPRT